MLGKEKNSKKILHSLGIGDNLRKIRNDYNLTLDEVSEATAIASETIRRLEKNQFEPKLSTLEVLSDYYRVDIIELLARKRRNTSIFSENLIKRINDFLNQQDFDGLKVFTNSLLNSSDFDLISSNINLKSFLYALKYIKYDPVNGQNDTISILEAILVNMTPSSKEKNQNMYPFPLEISISLILSVVYRQNGDYQKAINLLTNLISRIQKLPFINDRFSDYLSVSYLNLAYTYHSSSNPLKVIETVNESFSNSNVNYTRTTFSHLLFRKGLSLFILGDSDHEAFLITALSLMDEDTRNMIEHHLLKNYNYVIKKK